MSVASEGNGRERPGLRGLSLGIAFLTVVISLIGFGIVLPLLPFYATELGATPLTVGLIIASYSAVQLLGSPVWGRLSDRFGRRPILLIGLFGSAVSYAIFALADSVEVLLLSRIVGGAMGATVPVAQAYVADRAPLEKRARAMGLIGAAFGIGFVLGPAIGGLLSRWGYAFPGFFAAGLSLVAASVAIFFLPESLPPEERSDSTKGGLPALREKLALVGKTIGSPLLRDPIGATFLATLGFTIFTTAFPLLLDEPMGRSATDAGLFFAAGGLISATAQGGLVGPAVERVGERIAALLGALTAAVGLVILTMPRGTLGILVAISLLSVGWGLVSPALLGLLSRRADDLGQGWVLGINQSAGAMARVIGPIAAGWAFGRLGYPATFTGGALVLFVAAVWLAVMRRAAPVGRSRSDGPERAARLANASEERGAPAAVERAE